MIILLLMMLTVSVVITAILIQQSKETIKRQHFRVQVENERRYELFTQELNGRAIIWLEGFTSMSSTGQQTPASLSATLEGAKDYLRLNRQIKDFWLYDGELTLYYGEQSAPTTLFYPYLETTQRNLTTQFLLHCEAYCQQYLFVPVMTESGAMPVIVISTGLQELLSMMGQTVGTKLLALVQQSTPGSALPLRFVSQLTDTNQREIEAVLENLGAAYITELVEKGHQVDTGKGSYLLNLIPMTPVRGKETFILLVQDITGDVARAKRYEKLVAGSAVGLFTLFSILMYLFLNQYRYRLMDISRRLPLLAQHRYQEFRHATGKSGEWRQRYFRDELDVLESTAEDLAHQLEDIDSRMAINTAQLEKMAMFDALTGLPNRNMLTYQVEKQLAAAARSDDIVALMFLDLDDFKKVNDSHGHDVGDKLLKAAALRISAPIRDNDIASRFGGDEFVVLLSQIGTRDQVEVVAKKLLNAFSTPIDVDDKQFYITVSIGIAITRQSQSSAVDLLRHADIAMYEAKEQQGPSFRIYDSTMNLKVMRKVELESEARIALRDDQFYLALQPQLELRNRKLVGFEALLRWEHPEKGPIAPNDFIPLLEHTSFMLELDYWVIARATRLLREMSANGLTDVKMAINLSSAHFLDPSLPEFLQQQIIEQRIAPSMIELELTENVLVADITRATHVMEQIKAMGCLIAIDDFGTGYSSLSYLKALPADYIKIDQSFIAGMVDNPDDRSIVYSTITMVRNMGLKVIAEGLEIPAQYELLCHFNCHQGQGYLISKPIPESELWATLNEKLAGGVWTGDLPVFDVSADTSG